MQTLILPKNRHILAHTAVWLIFLIVFLVRINSDEGKLETHFLLMLTLNLVLFYVNYLFLVPKFLLKKKIFLYLVFSGVLVFSPLLFDGPPPPPRVIFPDGPPPKGRPSFLFIPVITNLAFLMIGTAIRIYIQWNRDAIHKKEVEYQQSQMELHFLKNQLNPHFLFNSLNSIYSLSAKKSDDAPEAIITLSELMRYMLYQTDREFVPLQEELDYIQNFLKLQRLRIARNENVTFAINGDVTAQRIKPLLLISFIENAFKYGTDYKGNTEVKISIEVSQQQLKFTCINLIGRKLDSGENGGIGLKNTRERLDLLYAGKHELDVFEENDRFHVYLTLDLTL